jgi:ribitol 2-dehydrogenase
VGARASSGPHRISQPSPDTTREARCLTLSLRKGRGHHRRLVWDWPATARALANIGSLLVISARSVKKLEEAAQDLGDVATAVTADVTSPQDVDNLVRTTIELHGRIDVLVPNAGVYTRGAFASADLTELLRLIDTNVSGVVRAIHAALQHVIPAGTGDIVVTSSVSGHQAIHWEPMYSASKHAVQALSHGLRRQLIGTGVRIGAIALALS